MAWRIWHGQAEAPVLLQQRARDLAGAVPATPGRVHGMGRFRHDGVWQSLKTYLPAALAAAVKPQFEWYGCRGAGFHTDAHYQDVLFGAWCLAGPARLVVFAGGWLALSCAPSSLVMFDPFLPHAVLDPGQARYERQHYDGAGASMFLGFEVELTATARAAFGIGRAEPGALVVGSATAVDAETGAFVR